MQKDIIKYNIRWYYLFKDKEKRKIKEEKSAMRWQAKEMYWMSLYFDPIKICSAFLFQKKSV
jgi:outer membrane protein assembly factor BamE (lipoprotein component of BamABCDE complex)